ncbi:hypothetical protein ACE6H2_002682 [Prunus campanulata]
MDKKGWTFARLYKGEEWGTRVERLFDSQWVYGIRGAYRVKLESSAINTWRRDTWAWERRLRRVFRVGGGLMGE